MKFDIIVVGAGAAGLMCAIEAARRGKRVVVLDHAARPAEKIRISGGGKCNFTHLHATPKNYLSDNPSFCISALKRFTAQDFLDRVTARGIAYYEKSEDQLFCVNGAQEIIDMLLDDLRDSGGELRLKTAVDGVTRGDEGFEVETSAGRLSCAKLVMASGGLSIPKMGATGLAYEIARQFGHDIVATRAALVPFALGDDKLAQLAGLAGVSLTARVSVGKTGFTDGFLFTHRGLSGPAVLQASSYWQVGDRVEVDLLPGVDAMALLLTKKRERPKAQLGTILGEILPARLAEKWIAIYNLPGTARMADLSASTLTHAANSLNFWTFTPMGTEGYRTAEVTAGGVDTRQLSSQTLESRLCPGLHFIGEAVDVTGWLGGYNFQWAWSSGWAAGRAV